jgi:holo-[acyl-carrier protein] synthase
MILGLGVDVVEVSRFERAVARHGEGFLREFLLPSEISRWRSPRLLPMSALHFAAKEAFFKALGTGKRGPMAWHDIELCARTLVLGGETARRAAALGMLRSHVSLALAKGRHGPTLASALVLLEGEARAGFDAPAADASDGPKGSGRGEVVW